MRKTDINKRGLGIENGKIRCYNVKCEMKVGVFYAADCALCCGIDAGSYRENEKWKILYIDVP